MGGVVFKSKWDYNRRLTQKACKQTTKEKLWEKVAPSPIHNPEY